MTNFGAPTMSKNCELFINLCNFMKYLLNEILPDQEPTESVKDAAQDVFFAIITYAKRLKYDISSLSNKSNDFCLSDFKDWPQFCNSFTNNQKNDNYDAVLLSDSDQEGMNVMSTTIVESESLDVCETPSIDKVTVKQEILSPIDDLLADKKTTYKVKQETSSPLISKSPSTNLKNNSSVLIKTEKIDSKSKKSPLLNSTKRSPKVSKSSGDHVKKSNEEKPLSTKNIKTTPVKSSTYLKEDSKIKQKPKTNSKDPEGKELSSPPGTNLSRKMARSLFFSDTHLSLETDEAFEGNFLKFYFYSDFIVKDTGRQKNSKPQKEREVFIMPEFIKLKEVSFEFEAINECLRSKLVPGAYFCWMCKTTFDTCDELESHSKDWKIHGSPLKSKEVFSLIDLCTDCSFTAFIPDSMIGKLMDLHCRSHIESKSANISLTFTPSNKAKQQSRPPGIPLIENPSFVDSLLLKKKKYEASDTPTFLGICLICQASFKSPLEWNYHLYEFRHLILPSESLKLCTPCCIVILGRLDDKIDQYFHSVTHKLQCRAHISNDHMGNKH